MKENLYMPPIIQVAGYIGLLKWSALLFGMIAGAYLSIFVKQHVWVFASVAVILAIRPAIKYFKNNDSMIRWLSSSLNEIFKSIYCLSWHARKFDAKSLR